MNKSEKNIEDIRYVHSLEIEFPISDHTLNKLKTESKNDALLSEIRKNCISGWPDIFSKNCINLEIKAFYKVKDILQVKDDSVLFNDKLVIPKKPREFMFAKLHDSAHYGIEKCKARARQIFYWPGMSGDVHDFVSKCDVCLKFSRNNIKEPMIQHDRPNIPYFKVAADILTFGNCDYLVVVDYFSNWIDLVKLNEKTALEVIKKLKSMFSSHGIPVTFMSDIMPFNSNVFKVFANDWDFNLITSSSKYPKSNELLLLTTKIQLS